MSSQAVHDFCNAAREIETLQAQRKHDTLQANEARRTAEQVLIETLGENARAKVMVDDEPYLIRVQRKDVYSTYGSAIVERMSSLWRDVDEDTLRNRIECSDCENIVDACISVLLEQAGIVPRTKLCLQVQPFKEKKTPIETPTLSDAQIDVAKALIRAKSEVTKGREEHREEIKRCTLRSKEAEVHIIHELSQLEAGQVKRVNMMEHDGSSTSYYLRLKKTRKPPKRKITVKILRKNIQAVLNNSLNPHMIQDSLNTFCSFKFAQEFTTELKNVLVQHEVPKTPKNADENLGARVALDKLRCRH